MGGASCDCPTMEKIKINLGESAVLRSKQEVIFSIRILSWAKNVASLFPASPLSSKPNFMAFSFCVPCLFKIHREVAFNKTTQALSKWDPIVLKNRQAEQLVFPLRKEQSAFAPIEHVLSGWKVSALGGNCPFEGKIAQCGDSSICS